MAATFQQAAALRGDGSAAVSVTWHAWPTGEDVPPTATPVLVVVQDGMPATVRSRRVLRAKYVRQFTMSCESFEYEGDADYDVGTDEFYWPAGWYEWNDSGDGMHYMISDRVTHWALLPGLPEVQP